MKRFILHWITKKSDSLFLHFSCSQMLPAFLHLVFFSWSSSQTSWTVFDTNCLYTPTCPPCLPPTGQVSAVLEEIVYVSGWSLARCRRSPFTLLNNMYYSSFITAGQLELEELTTLRTLQNSHYCHYSLCKIHYLTFTALWKAARFELNLWNCWVTLGIWLQFVIWSCWFSKEKHLAHLLRIAVCARLQLLRTGQHIVSSPPERAYFSTMYSQLQHVDQSLNSLFHLSPGRAQIICVHKEFVMIINDTLSLYNHLYCGISSFSGSNWQKRISWESWARGTQGRYRKF